MLGTSCEGCRLAGSRHVVHGYARARRRRRYLRARGRRPLAHSEPAASALSSTKRLRYSLNRPANHHRQAGRYPHTDGLAVSGIGSGKGHLEYGYGFENQLCYWDKYYHFVFVPDVGFPATEKSDTTSACNYHAAPQSAYPKPTMAMMRM